MSITRRLIALGLVLSTARADVVVVDTGGLPGADLLKRTIAAAEPGDVLLLEPGEYQQDAFTYFIDKGITLMPASTAARITLGPVQIERVPHGQTVVLRGFDIHNHFAGGTNAVLVSASRGGVWIEDCEITGSDGQLHPFPALGGTGGNAVSVSGAQVIFRHCRLAGGPGADASPGVEATTGGDALHTASFATVALHDCTLVGGDFGNGLSPSSQTYGITAGRALNTTYSDVTISGCTLTGGQEGADNDALPGTSGSALRSVDAGSVRVLQSVLLAGAVQGQGTQAPAVDAAPGTVEFLDEPARALVLPALAQVGQVVTLFLDGEPGDAALVVTSPQAGASPVPSLEGTLALDPGSFPAALFVGVLAGPDGQLSLPWSVAGLPPGVEATTLFSQVLVQDADGRSLGGASAITWIATSP